MKRSEGENGVQVNILHVRDIILFFPSLCTVIVGQTAEVGCGRRYLEVRIGSRLCCVCEPPALGAQCLCPHLRVRGEYGPPAR